MDKQTLSKRDKYLLIMIGAALIISIYLLFFKILRYEIMDNNGYILRDRITNKVMRMDFDGKYYYLDE